MKELQELHDLLEKEYPFAKASGLGIYEADEWEELAYLGCDEKVVNFVDGYYHVSDINNVHKTLQFKTKEEVLAFFNGHIEGYHFYFEDPIEAANAIGRLTTILDSLKSKEFQDGFNKALSPLNKTYS